MRLLELFSGTGSVKKAVGDQFDEVVSIDILPKFNPTICSDILTWDYRQYPPGYFNTIWASPPCIEYSRMKDINHKIPDLEGADRIVKRTLEIIEYFQPANWFLENPSTGKLKDRPFMLGIPFVDVDYCCYSDWGYKKPTRIWTLNEFTGRKCEGRNKCPNMTDNHHNAVCQTGNSYRNGVKLKRCKASSHDTYRIPEALIKALFLTNTPR